MCINFFYPLFYEKILHVIPEFFELREEKINYDMVKFEKDSEIEKAYGMKMRTNFDFYFETESGKRFFFEIKYTENSFGKAGNKPDRQSKNYNNIYKPILEWRKRTGIIDITNEKKVALDIPCQSDFLLVN